MHVFLPSFGFIVPPTLIVPVLLAPDIPISFGIPLLLPLLVLILTATPPALLDVLLVLLAHPLLDLLLWLGLLQTDVLALDDIAVHLSVVHKLHRLLRTLLSHVLYPPQLLERNLLLVGVNYLLNLPENTENLLDIVGSNRLRQSRNLHKKLEIV